MSLAAIRPVDERIADSLFQRLQLLRAGFSPTSPVKSVVRPTRQGGFTPEHLQIVLTNDDPTEVEELYRPGNPPAVGWELNFDIKCHLSPSERDPTPIETMESVIVADVKRVVSDSSYYDHWYTFDSLAINAFWGPTRKYNQDGGGDAISVSLRVQYRTDENNPYAVRK